MPEIQPDILLLSSNLRRRYAEDILTALALPNGALIQFRYDADYVAPSLQQKLADKSAINCHALLAFIADQQTPKKFVLPVRFATVVYAENLADMFVFKLRVSGYPNLDNAPLSLDENLPRK